MKYLLILTMCLSAAACEPEPYDQIAAGQGVEDVIAILGIEAFVEVPSPGLLRFTWWKDGAFTEVVFLRDRVVAKSRGTTR
jgi:hypothetical protein